MSMIDLDEIDEAGATRQQIVALAERVAAGEEIVIARKGTPVAKVVAVEPEAEAPRRPRVGGQLRGQIWISDDFDAPLPKDIASAFGMDDT